MKELYCFCHEVAVEGKENMIKLAQELINNKNTPMGQEESYIKWYQLAVDNELIGPIKDMLGHYHQYTTYFRTNDWIMYHNADYYSLNTDYLVMKDELHIPLFSSPTRAVITSYIELIKNIENNFFNEYNDTGFPIEIDINSDINKNSLNNIQKRFEISPNCIFTIEVRY